jgi:hypothetical protein
LCHQVGKQIASKDCSPLLELGWIHLEITVSNLWIQAIMEGSMVVVWRQQQELWQAR